MKTFLCSLLFASIGIAQVNFTVTGQISTAEFNSLEAWRITINAPSQPSVTLTAPVTSGATSISVSALPAGWTQGLASARPATCTQLDPPAFPLNLFFATDTGVISTCVATNVFGVFGSQIVIDGEPMTVTAFSGLSLAVTRGQAGVAAAAHNSGAVVSFLKFPSAPLLAKQFIRDGLGDVLVTANAAQIQTLQNQVTTDQAAITKLQTGAVR